MLTDLLWDGEEWVKHDGVIYKGEREVIEYDGLIATKDHLVFVEGEQEPIQFKQAAAYSQNLIQTGDGRRTLRLGRNYKSREEMEQKDESLLCANQMSRLWKHSVAKQNQSNFRKIKRLSTLLPTKKNTIMVRQKINFRKATMRKSKRQRVQKLWCKRNTIRFFKCIGCWAVLNKYIWTSKTRIRNRQDRQRWTLRKGEYSLRQSQEKQSKQTKYGIVRMASTVLALCQKRGCQNVIKRDESSKYNRCCVPCGCRTQKKLAVNRGKARVYDIRNAGKHHCFTVSNKLVHNCGYGGSVGALTAMGALDMGLTEEELKPLVDVWRESNPNIVNLWWSVDMAVKDAVKGRTTTKTHGIQFSCKSGLLRITLPSKRQLTYIKPRIEMNKFGGESVTYEGVGATKKWERIESYGPKFVENIVQAIARDILVYALKNLSQYNIVAHVHDEVIIEAPRDTKLDNIITVMSEVPNWASGLILNADGYVCDFYKKD